MKKQINDLLINLQDIGLPHAAQHLRDYIAELRAEIEEREREAFESSRLIYSGDEGTSSYAYADFEEYKKQ
jgi:hypothetical protein